VFKNKTNEELKGKIPITSCKKILNKNNCFDDEEIRKIRDFLYVLAEIDFLNYLKQNKNEKSGSHIY